MKGFKDSSGTFHPITEYKGVRKSRDQKEKTQGVKIRKQRVVAGLTNNDKQILSDWVKQNRDWTTIDDLPNDIFIPLVSRAGDDIDKRVKIEVQTIDYMKSITKKLSAKTRKAREQIKITNLTPERIADMTDKQKLKVLKAQMKVMREMIRKLPKIIKNEEDLTKKTEAVILLENTRERVANIEDVHGL